MKAIKTLKGMLNTPPLFAILMLLGQLSTSARAQNYDAGFLKNDGQEKNIDGSYITVYYIQLKSIIQKFILQKQVLALLLVKRQRIL